MLALGGVMDIRRSIVIYGLVIPAMVACVYLWTVTDVAPAEHPALSAVLTMGVVGLWVAAWSIISKQIEG
jgi:hypothetical protein